MQIDRYNYLQFPRDNTANAPGNDAATAAPGTGLAKPQAKAAVVPPPAASVRSDSVVLKIQWPDSPSADAVRNDAPVYSKAPNNHAALDTTTPDSQLQDHQRAIDRNAGVFTQITLNKDGVLVAKPQPAAQAKAPDFVALAVSAMREFSDEADRQKARANVSNAPAPEAPRGALKGLQQLAAKFNVFA